MTLAVDIREKEVQRPDALNEPPLDMLPLPGEYEAGNAIDGDDSFDRLLVPVHGEGDALVEKGAGHTLLKSRDLLSGHPLHFVDKELVVRAGLPCGLKGFVKKLRVKLVVPKE
jgi:hypothetical protein